MKRLIYETVARPVSALASGLDLLGREMSAGQTADGMVSRVVHNMSRSTQAPPLTDEDQFIISSVDRYLEAGRALKQWWVQAFASNSFKQKFELQRVFNRADRSFGFFDEITFEDRPLQVMGNYQELFYDQPRTPASLGREAAEWMQGQIREFVLRYFMRVSAFRPPAVYTESQRPDLPHWLSGINRCPRTDIAREGFGFSQLYYKLRDTGEIGKFASEEESSIVDLREIGTKYEWIIVRVRIFDFKFTLRPLGAGSVEISVPLAEDSYLVLSPDFIINDDDPSDLLGRYGLGYAFIRNPTQGLLAYGPGEFEAAIELITFEVQPGGETRVNMAFVSNRPERIANLQLDPITWSFKLADLFSFGLTSKILSPVKSALEQFPAKFGSFDPVYSSISLANLLTANQATEQLCISREQLERDFLAQHFTQHYTTIVGSLLTWRQIPNWLDTQALPAWVIDGRSS